MIAQLTLISTLAFSAVLPAEPRTWKSSDGSSSFGGHFVSMEDDQVTIRRDDGREFTLPLEKLHQTDRKWIADQSAPDPAAVFDTLKFGDSRERVEEKLKASKVLECSVDPKFLGRVGLNGTFRTRQRVGGQQCELYFDWTPAGTLKEITLQTQGFEAAGYPEELQESWQGLAKLLTTLNGRPLQATSYPKSEDLENDLFLGSHLWRLAGGGSAVLGTSMQAGKYIVVVRFTAEKIEPVRNP